MRGTVVSACNLSPKSIEGATMNRTDEELARVVSLNARIACQRRDWRTAETLASQAIEADPELVDAYMARGLARRVRGDLAGAEDDYSAAIQHDPALAAAFKWRAGVRSCRAAYLRGEAAERYLLAAESDFRQAVLLNPGDEQARLGGEPCDEAPQRLALAAGDAHEARDARAILLRRP